MNDRFRNDRGRGGQPGAQGNQRLYSSDEDETLGSEWERDREPRYGQGAAFGQGSGYDQSGVPRYGQGGSYDPRDERPRYGQGGGGGFRNRGNVGNYGSGTTGYSGGRAGGGYGGSTGTDYGGGSYGGGSYGGRNYSGSSSYSSGTYGTEADDNEGHRGENRYTGSSYGAGTTRGDGQVAWSGSQSRTGGGFAGRGPKGYSRTDDRIREDVCERLSVDDDVDASEIEVRVAEGEVTLEGTVQTRSMKHHAENLADEVSGVKDVHNRLRVTTGLLTEIKDKVSGQEKERHYANSGTKDKPANGTL